MSVGNTVYYESVDALSENLNITTPICSTAQTITMGGINGDGFELSFSGFASADIAETASTDAVYSLGGQELTLTFSTSAPYYATSPVAGTDGRIGNTLYFPGDDQGYLEVLNSEGLGEFSTADFTIMGWVKTDQTSVPIWAKDDGDGVYEQGEKFLTVNGDGLLIMWSVGNGNIISVRTTEAINDNVWHHFAVTWNYDGTGTGGTAAIYIDGVDVTGNERLLGRLPRQQRRQLENRPTRNA